MNQTNLRKLFGAALAACVLPSCGGAVGEALRPTDHTATGALTAGNGAKACAGNPTYVKPLIVDLDPDTRVDLEAAMKKGVIVVSYDCANLRVLTGCKLPDASYEYAGVSRKEQVVQIKNADDLSVNLPLSSAKLSGELKSGRTVDLALVLVGRRSTTLGKVLRDDLVGACDGATHYVQNATLGAFSMQTGSIGKVSAVAEMFGRGGKAGSESERKAMSSDGSLDDCRTSNPDADAPPTECRAPLRVELLPIAADDEATAKTGKKGDKAAEKKGTEAQKNPCPPGYAFTDGLCTSAPEKARLCDPKNEAECKDQCDKGSNESCYNYGRLLVKKSPRAASVPYFKKACDAEIADGCAALGIELAPVDDEAPDYKAKAREAYDILKKACSMGAGSGCDFAGDALTDKSYGFFDEAAAARSYDRGCSLGDGNACWSLARMYFNGKGVPKDARMGIAALNKACQGGSADECAELGNRYKVGVGDVAADPQAALRAYTRACDIDVDYCIDAVKMAITAGRSDDAFNFANRGCRANDEEACAKLGDFYDAGTGTAKDPGKANDAWKKSCNNGDGEESACKRLGIPMKD